jgi:hypothetical protein
LNHAAIGVFVQVHTKTAIFQIEQDVVAAIHGTGAHKFWGTAAMLVQK